MEGQGRILFVDDEETFLCATAELLRNEGYACDCAPDAAAATEKLKNNRYDLLIADIKMPGNMELEFIKSLPGIADGLPVILVTAYPDVTTAIESIKLRVAAYLLKPIDMDEFLDRVALALSQARVLRTVRSTRERLDAWRENLAHLDPSRDGVGGKGSPAVLETYLDLHFSNMAGMLSDLKHLTLALGNDRKPLPEACHLFNCPKLDRFTQALSDTIGVLEKTKGSFKSKELGELRKKLEALLRENLQTSP